MLTGPEKITLITLLDEAGYDLVSLLVEEDGGPTMYAGRDVLSISLRKKVPAVTVSTASYPPLSPPMP